MRSRCRLDQVGAERVTFCHEHRGAYGSCKIKTSSVEPRHATLVVALRSFANVSSGSRLNLEVVCWMVWRFGRERYQCFAFYVFDAILYQLACMWPILLQNSHDDRFLKTMCSIPPIKWQSRKTRQLEPNVWSLQIPCPQIKQEPKWQLSLPIPCHHQDQLPCLFKEGVQITLEKLAALMLALSHAQLPSLLNLSLLC